MTHLCLETNRQALAKCRSHYTLPNPSRPELIPGNLELCFSPTAHTGCVTLRGDSDHGPLGSSKLLEVLWAPRKWLEGSLDPVVGVHSHS